MSTPATSRGHFPRPEAPAPRTVAALSRVELCGRIHTLRAALDTLWSQVDRDGAEPFACIGRAKAELVTLEEQLRQHDRAAGDTLRPAWHSAALTSAAALERLAACRQAELSHKEADRGLTHAEAAELAELVRSVAVAGARSMAPGGCK